MIRYLNFNKRKLFNKDIFSKNFFFSIYLSLFLDNFFYWKTKYLKMILQCMLLSMQNPTSNFSQI